LRSLSPVACRSYTTPSGNQTITDSKIVKDYIKSYKGCDSIIYTLTVTIDKPDVGTTRIMNTLSATTAQTGATFQWLDCQQSMAKIGGATNRDFTPASDGRYALSVTENNCTDTSACITFAINGVSNPLMGSLRVYPNPTDEVFVIESGERLNGVSLQLVSMQGQLLRTWQLEQLTKLTLSVGEDLPRGLYYLCLSSNEGQQVIFVAFQ